MSRPSISTDSVLFTRRSAGVARHRPEDDQPLHVAVIADFSGRGSRGEADPEGLARRRAIEIDRDNFDDVFARLDVRLQLPFEEQPVHFGEIDDLHPDVLLEQLDLFSEFRRLLRQLGKRDSFERAAGEIRGWAEVPVDSGGEADTVDAGDSDAPPGDLFDAVLGASREQAEAAMQSAGNVNRLIQAIVAPYIEPREHPELETYRSAVEDAMAQTLRRVMHAPAFQRLEANWRALQLLVSRLETDTSLKLFLVDASREELIDDVINAEELTDTALYRGLVLARQEPGTTPFGVVVSDVEIDDDLDALRLAAALGQIAESVGGLALCPANSHLAGCADLAGQVDASDWDYAPDALAMANWEAFRHEDSARSLVACAPRFLVRLPYGARNEPIESFDFEELGDQRRHDFYCWAPGSYLVALCIATGFTVAGRSRALEAVREVGDLPVHVYRDDDGESCAQACAEVFLRDRAATALADAGICCLRSIRGRDAVAVPAIRSAHVSGAPAFGAAGA